MVALAVVTVLAVIAGLGYVGVNFLGADIPVDPFGTSSSSAPPTSARPDQPVVGVDRLLTAGQVSHLDPDTVWEVARTQEGRDDQAPVAVCLNRPTAEDVAPQTSALRTMTTTAGPEMSLLHESSLYSSNEEAAQVLTHLARQLGGCSTSGAYIAHAENVTGLGNQALTAQVRVTPAVADAEVQFHTILIVRTGTVVNVVDVVAEGDFVDTTQVAETLIPVVNQQCVAAGGYCAQRATVTRMVPPIGDAPGLPVLADIPPLPAMTGRWSAGDVVENPNPLPDFTGCERFASSSANIEGTAHRTYLVQDDDSIPATYGWDLVVFSTSSAKQASTLVDDVSTSISECGTRQRTAEVSDEQTWSGAGTEQIEIDVTSWVVRQETGADAYIDYRVALIKADNKVAYVFLPLVDGDVNFTDSDWEDLTVRIGQRTTQVV